jgi:hypothetical protein
VEAPVLPNLHWALDRKPAAREMGWQTRAVATECCEQPAIAVVATYQIGQLTSQTKAEVFYEHRGARTRLTFLWSLELLALGFPANQR